jgi:hypothetical protein
MNAFVQDISGGMTTLDQDVAIVIIYALLMMAFAAGTAVLVALIWVLGLGIVSLLRGHHREGVRR